MLTVQTDGIEALRFLLLYLVDKERRIDLAVFSRWNTHRHECFARDNRIGHALVREVDQASMEGDDLFHRERLLTDHAADGCGITNFQTEQLGGP
ncbi:hypothetical protein D3C81_1909730 [compost metagenome]